MSDATTYPGDLVLRAGKACAVLRPNAGGRVCSLTLARDDGRTVDVLFPYTAQGVDPLRWGKGGIYPLVPYSNRIANAQVQTPGGVVQLTPHPARACAWFAMARAGARCAVRHTGAGPPRQRSLALALSN